MVIFSIMSHAHFEILDMEMKAASVASSKFHCML